MQHLRPQHRDSDDSLWALAQLLFVGLLLMSLVHCAPGHVPPPSPQPSSVPTTTIQPPPAGTTITVPLMVKGTRFIDGRTGATLRMMGPVGCCEAAKDLGWPWANERLMRIAQDHKANTVFVRLGPFTSSGEEPAQLFDGDPTLYSFEPYIRLAHPTPGYHSMYDPRDGFAPGYWVRLRKLVESARRRGLYVVLDLIDGWVLRNNKLVNVEGTMVNDLSPWESAEPIIKLSVPRTWHREWVEKIALETGGLANVLYSIGNENFLPPRAVGPLWELGIRDLIRGVERAKGYPRHLIGTNSMLPEIERQVDYVIEHGPVAHPPRWGKPLINAESSDKLSGPSWAVEAKRARQMGSEMMLWRGDMLDGEWEIALAAMAQLQ